jgi:glucose 1-dehydrogenase
MTSYATKPLQGRAAIVTGASSGIGAAIARRLAAAGAAVGINHRSSPAAAESVAHAIKREGGRALTLAADVSQEASVSSMFRGFATTFGRVDILVANAGIQRDAPFADMTLEQWRAVIDTNLTGYFLCAREAIRQFLHQGTNTAASSAIGNILFISSVHELIPWAGHVNYAAAKGGVMQLTRSLAQEVAERHIRVNSIAPGAIATNINRPAWETPEAKENLLHLIPYGRVGVPEDVAEAALWLLSDASDYVVGTTLFIDGGMSLYPEFRHGG